MFPEVAACDRYIECCWKDITYLTILGNSKATKIKIISPLKITKYRLVTLPQFTLLMPRPVPMTVYKVLITSGGGNCLGHGEWQRIQLGVRQVPQRQQSTSLFRGVIKTKNGKIWEIYQILSPPPP